MSEKRFRNTQREKRLAPGGAALPAEPPARICREASFTKPTAGLADIFASQTTTAWAEMRGRARQPECRPAEPLLSESAGAGLVLGPRGSLCGGNPATARRRRAVWATDSTRGLRRVGTCLLRCFRCSFSTRFAPWAPGRTLREKRPADGIGLVDRRRSVWSPRLAPTGFPIRSLLQSLSSWPLCL